MSSKAFCRAWNELDETQMSSLLPEMVAVVGTAGHIDHGKTALVHRLTGIDTDRLPAEKERGISIDLGFAHFEPVPGLRISFVDVPGHEKFVKNMLAGATGIDIVLFVVAADEGLMPQSREHFDILCLLGIRRIIPVITKIDRVDEDFLEIVQLELEELFELTLGLVPTILAVSSRTGEGFDALSRALVEETRSLPPRRGGRIPRLSIDRCFVLAGHGTIVTGTQAAGRFRKGMAVEILPSKLKGRIRELQTHGGTVEESGPGQRTAMKLHGVSAEEIHRGDIVTLPGALETTSILNARIHVLESSPIFLERRTRVRVHVGAAELFARVMPLEPAILKPGESGFVQLRLESPSVAVAGQRLILRRYSPALTLGGGIVVEAPAQKLAAANAKEIDILRKFELSTPESLAQAMASRMGVDGVEIGAVETEAARRGLEFEPATPVSGLRRLGDEFLVEERLFREMETSLLKQLEAHHERWPLKPGVRPEKLRVGLLERNSPKMFQALLADLQEGKRIVLDGAFCRMPGFMASVTPETELRLQELIKRLEKKGIIREEELLGQLEELGHEPTELLDYLVDNKIFLRLGSGAFTEQSFLAKLLAQCQNDLQTPEGMGIAQLREKTGWTRKFCIPFFELTDGLCLTRRQGDTRVAGTALAPFLRSILP